MSTPRWPVGRLARVRAVLLAALVAVLAAVALMQMTSDDGGARVARPDSLDQRGDRSLLEDGTTSTWTGTHIAVHSSERPFTKTVRITSADSGLVLDPVEVQCHDGVVNASWYVGNLEPVTPMTGIHLSLRMDGEVVSSVLVGSTDGVWNDQPTTVRAVLECPAGSHRFDLLVHEITGGWGIPYVQNVADRHGGLVVRRGLTVRETYEPKPLTVGEGS